MQIYLACDSKHRYFIDAVERTVRRVRRSNSSVIINLIFNPRRFGGDTGLIVPNILRIMDSDLIFFDITPSIVGRQQAKQTYNSGTMIEYGLVLASENPRSGTPWSGRHPKPSFLVFSSVPRGTLTPILNQISIIPYRKGRDGRKKLVTLLYDEINRKIAELSIPPQMAVTIAPGIAPGILWATTAEEAAPTSSSVTAVISDPSQDIKSEKQT